MNNMAFGKYIPIDSFIHRRDPRLKISLLFAYLITVFFNIGFIGYGLLGVYAVLVIYLSKIGLKNILNSIKPMMMMMIFLLFFNIFLLKTGDVVFTIFSIKIYSGALLQSAYIFIRILLIISLTTILTATTKPLELTLAIEDLLTPLKRFKFPTHELAMMISIALRFIPDLIDETNRIMKAQASRGVDFNEGKLNDKIKAIISLIIPLFLSAFQRAEDLANAMESRNYNPESTRTRYKNLVWESVDTSCTILSIGCFVSIIIMSFVLW